MNWGQARASTRVGPTRHFAGFSPWCPRFACCCQYRGILYSIIGRAKNPGISPGDPQNMSVGVFCGEALTVRGMLIESLSTERASRRIQPGLRTESNQHSVIRAAVKKSLFESRASSYECRKPTNRPISVCAPRCDDSCCFSVRSAYRVYMYTSPGSSRWRLGELHWQRHSSTFPNVARMSWSLVVDCSCKWKFRRCLHLTLVHGLSPQRILQ